MKVVRRAAPAPAKVTIQGSLGAMLSRRLGDAPAPQVPGRQGKSRKAGGEIVVLPDPESKVLTSILSKARNIGRAKRPGTHIHVSDLLSKCLRKKAIVERHKVSLPTAKLSIMDSLTFAQGDAIHDTIKERSALGAPSLVWGKWKCACGTHRIDKLQTFAEVDTTEVCKNCGGTADVYDEAEFIDAEYDIVGHPDLLLYLTDLDAFYVTELKSISDAQYKELVRPKAEHVLQALFYWFLMKRKGYRMVDTISILYVTKGYTFRGDPYTEFTFKAPTELRRLAPYLEDAKALLRARKGGELPARTQCASREATDARACEVAGICFDGPPKEAVTVSFARAMRLPGSGR